MYVCVYMVVCVYIEGGGSEIHFKELTHTITETGKSKIRQVDQQAGNLGKRWCCCPNPKDTCCKIPSCSGEVSLVFYSGLQLI